MSASAAPVRGEAVPVRGDDRPRPEAPAQVPVDDRARAHLRRRIDVRLEQRVRRYRAGVVMIEPLHRRRRARSNRFERGVIAVEGDVEHRDPVARRAVDALEERDLALRAGDEQAFRRRREPELVQGAEPVGVAVEDVELRRAAQLRDWGCVTGLAVPGLPGSYAKPGSDRHGHAPGASRALPSCRP